MIEKHHSKAIEEADAARTTIDIDTQLSTAVEQMRQLQERILSLKSARNTRAPINRLPVELLSLTFEFYIRTPQLDFNKLSKYGIPSFDTLSIHTLEHPRWADFMRIVNVCHRWRTTALDTPGFWSQVIFRPADPWIAEEMLARSMTSPLDIRMPIPVTPVKRAQHDHKTHHFSWNIDIQRIRELHLGFEGHELDVVMESIFQSGHQAKLLRSMCVSMNSSPFDIFSLSMPNLQHLDLCFNGDETQWAALHAASRSNLSRLVSLKLVISQQQGSLRIGGRLYDILSVMPGLQTLHLDRARQRAGYHHPPGSSPQSEELHRVLLSNLSSCTIFNYTISQLADFHTNISYPATTTKVHFHTIQSDDGNGPAKMVELLNTLGLSEDNSRRSHPNLFISSLGLDGAAWTTGRNSIQFVLWDGGLESFPGWIPSFTSDDPPVVLDFGDRLLCDVFLRRLFIPGLTRVEIQHSTDTGFRTEEWLHFFSRHLDIEDVHVGSGSAVTRVVNALSTSLEEQHPEQPVVDRDHTAELPSPVPAGSPILCLPNLATLTVEDKTYFHWTSAPQAVRMERDRASAIAKCLIKRCNHGLQLQNLHFRFMMCWDVRAFKFFSDFVVSVTWTGLVPPYYHFMGPDLDDEDSSYVGSDSDVGSGGDAGGENADDTDDSHEEDDGEDDFWR